MTDCPDCIAIHAKLSSAERKRDVVTRLAKQACIREPERVEEMAVSVEAVEEDYELGKAAAEDHERQTGHKPPDIRHTDTSG
jgi:hypothetical protein